ncbi:MAG TPA: outer membrane beta-barrel protein [Devosia sp.]
MRTLAAALAVLFLATGAKAQEFNWTRFYAGPFAGFGFGQSTFTAPSVTATSLGTAGFSGGLLVGNTTDFNSFVVGGELDAQAGGWTGSAICSGAGNTCTTSIVWLATLRAKAGIATPVGLIYGTVGPAVGSIEAKVTPGGGTPRTVAQTRIGYAAGLGFEMPISDKVTLGAEYLYSDLWKLEDGGTTATAPMHTVRAGARFSF